MQKIGIVVFYFGSWPSWFWIDLATCKKNPTIDWLFFTDCETVARREGNLHFIPFTLEAFNTLASEHLDLKIRITQPYKLCDLRPAFGVILEEYLRPYDFWGHADLDVVYGNIRSFLTDEVLTNHLVIASRKEYLSGHFTLYRNKASVNRLFEQSEDYRDVFENPAYVNFDECNYLWHELLGGESVFERQPEVDSMTHVVKRMKRDEGFSVYFENLVRERMDLEGRGWKICWEDGRLTHPHSRDEIMYFHFHIVKKEASFYVPVWPLIPTRFCISNQGFWAF